MLGAYNKCTNVFPSPGFNSDAAIIAGEKRKANILIGTPTMFLDILGSKILNNHDLSSLTYAVLGGSPATPSLVRAAGEKLGTSMGVAYGMTETCGATFITPFGSGDDITTNTVGYPSPGITAKLIDEAGEIVKVGETGELCTKSIFTFGGFFIS